MVGSGEARFGLERCGQGREGFGLVGPGGARCGKGEVMRWTDYLKVGRGRDSESLPPSSIHLLERKFRQMARKRNNGDDGLQQRFGVELPYTIVLRLRGVRPLLFNRMDIESYDAEGEPAAKRKPRARPEYESMVWRDDDGNLAIPVTHVVASIVHAGKYFKTPIGSNGGATATLREALVPGAEYASFGVKEWDCIDFRKCNYANKDRSPKPTYRPRLEIGWLAEAPIAVTSPELYGPAKLLEIISRAGSAMGIGDGRKIGLGRYVLDSHALEEGLPW